jgi:hypothetical protein
MTYTLLKEAARHVLFGILLALLLVLLALEPILVQLGFTEPVDHRQRSYHYQREGGR